MMDNTSPKSWKSFLLVSLQFLCLGLIFWSGPLLAGSSLLLAFELAGLLVGIWAVLAMGLGNFHIAPDPLAWSRMVQRGPYRAIRHPMYLALLLTTFPLVADSFSLPRALVWLVLLLTLLYKMGYEENLLQARFESYREYLQRTSRLIPGLY